MKTFDYELVKNPEFFGDNRLPAHSDHMYFNSIEAAVSYSDDYCHYAADNFRYSLNGVWKFSYAPNYASAIKGFEAADYDCRSWADITVPAHIQLSGYDKPHYTNIAYPWDGHEKVDPGEIPTEFNPVGAYTKYFFVPSFMTDKPIYISFQGVESGMALFLNGTYVGYSEDSFTPAEFDLTPYIAEGENKLSLLVFKWTSGSWCEDQDFFRFSGIFRDVYLFTAPETHLNDIKLTPALSADFTRAVLSVDIKPAGCGSLVLRLLDDKENEVSKLSDSIYKNGHYELSLNEPVLWSAEIPYLYVLELQILNSSGVLSEVIRQNIGFRHFELKNGLMMLNGKRIVFKGVNRHEFSSVSGRAVSYEETLQDIVTMKQNNINAIRTCHYPNNSAIYALCDKYGLYMIDETNLETHGTWSYNSKDAETLAYAVPGDRPDWTALVLDRVNSIYQRDKNHTAILLWSCGNESFGGSNIYKMSQLFHKLDPSRLVHYEGIFNDRRYNDTSDIESQMYTSAANIKAFLSSHKDKPFICCEYTHAMGNSCGAMHKYTDLTDTEPQYQGGFIWDYIDQSLSVKDRYGNTIQAYGGDFGDRPTNGNFSGNGIVYGGDRRPSPKLQEVKFNYQNIAISFSGEESAPLITIKNKNLFLNTAELNCTVSINRNGVPYRSVMLETAVAPLSEESYKSPLTIPQLSGEYTLFVSFSLKNDTLWAKAGHEVAFGQHIFSIAAAASKELFAPLTVVHGTWNIGVKGTNFSVMFSETGLSSYCFCGHELIKNVVKPGFWRAPTDNDQGNSMPIRYAQWKLADMYQKCSRYKLINESSDSVTVNYTYTLATTPTAECDLTYTVTGDGAITCHLSYDPVPELGDMPEFGVRFTMDADYDNLEWYGFGPAESYSDRLHGAKLGLYKNKVADNMAHYLVPQECGNKLGVRYANITDMNRLGLHFEGQDLSFSCLPYTPHELENALHENELPQIHNTIIRVALAQMGIGGDDSWGARTHEEYLIDVSKRLEFEFRFRGIVR